MHGEKEKKNKYKELNIREGWFSIPQYNLSVLTCISNMQFPSYTIGVILRGNMWRDRKNEQRQESTNRRKLILYPRIQQVTDISYNKYDPSILNSC